MVRGMSLLPERGAAGPAGPRDVPGGYAGWPAHRTPRWLAFAGAGLLAVAVCVGLAVQPSRAARASDLRGFLSDMNTDIESCAGGVSESLTVLRQIEQGASGQRATAVEIAQTGASNCSPANSMAIDDLEQYQVAESLASFHLAGVVTGLVNWAAPDAVDVQTDVARVLTARGAAASATAMAALSRAIKTLDAQRSVLYAAMNSAIRSLSAHATPPRLPG